MQNRIAAQHTRFPSQRLLRHITESDTSTCSHDLPAVGEVAQQPCATLSELHLAQPDSQNRTAHRRTILLPRCYVHTHSRTAHTTCDEKSEKTHSTHRKDCRGISQGDASLKVTYRTAIQVSPVIAQVLPDCPSAVATTHEFMATKQVGVWGELEARGCHGRNQHRHTAIASSSPTRRLRASITAPLSPTAMQRSSSRHCCRAGREVTSQLSIRRSSRRNGTGLQCAAATTATTRTSHTTIGIQHKRPTHTSYSSSTQRMRPHISPLSQ
jgi:hypothetical protein